MGTDLSFLYEEKEESNQTDFARLRIALNTIDISNLLQPDKKRKGYICPFCNSGSGANGTGLVKRQMQDGVFLYYCNSQCKKPHNSIELYSYVKHGIINTKGKEGAIALLEMAKDYGIDMASYSMNGFIINTPPQSIGTSSQPVEPKFKFCNNIELLKPTEHLMQINDYYKILAPQRFKYTLYTPHELQRYKIFNLANVRKIKSDTQGNNLKGIEWHSKGKSFYDTLKSITNETATPYLLLDLRIREYNPTDANTLTAPFICIDIDSKVIENDKERAEYIYHLETELKSYFPNIYIEKSVSGKGRHIIFKADKHKLKAFSFIAKEGNNKHFNTKLIDLRTDNFMVFTADYTSNSESINHLLHIQDNEEGNNQFKRILKILKIYK